MARVTGDLDLARPVQQRVSGHHHLTRWWSAISRPPLIKPPTPDLQHSRLTRSQGADFGRGKDGTE